ncbi:MAG: sugar ABC transporter permease [Bauldia sp.]|nr:sugar ABC transporter permease [Bauldia sp.]
MTAVDEGARDNPAEDDAAPRETHWLARLLGGGDLGPLPVILGLVVVTIIFQAASDRFLLPQNIFNLSQQIAPVGVLALGIIFVLIIGEIDLSAGSVSGVTSAAMVVLAVHMGWDPVLAVVAAIAFGAAIGLFHGLIFTKLGVPSFVLTLGGLLAWQGAQLMVLGNAGTINLPYDGIIASVATTVLPAWVGYLIAAGYLAVSLAVIAHTARKRRQRNLPPRPLTGRLAVAVAIAALIVAATTIFSLWRGISLLFMIFLVLVTLVDILLSTTKFGRKLFAVGGNAEAARRAGIEVDRVKVVAFVLCSSFAALAGILVASRLSAVNQASGGNEMLLNAIAAAVIGGTSLFGGRGAGYSALLGMLVIGAVSNGMDLLNQQSDVKYIITGIVLVAAVVIDSVARRGRRTGSR